MHPTNSCLEKKVQRSALTLSSQGLSTPGGGGHTVNQHKLKAPLSSLKCVLLGVTLLQYILNSFHTHPDSKRTLARKDGEITELVTK